MIGTAQTVAETEIGKQKFVIDDEFNRVSTIKDGMIADSQAKRARQISVNRVGLTPVRL